MNTVTPKTMGEKLDKWLPRFRGVAYGVITGIIMGLILPAWALVMIGILLGLLVGNLIQGPSGTKYLKACGIIGAVSFGLVGLCLYVIYLPFMPVVVFFLAVGFGIYGGFSLQTEPIPEWREILEQLCEYTGIESPF